MSTEYTHVKQNIDAGQRCIGMHDQGFFRGYDFK